MLTINIFKMKKTAILSLSLLIGGMAYGQSSVKGEAKEGLTVMEVPAATVNHDQTEANSAATIWSEDFSGGIPSTWSQSGSPSGALWVYRGSNTTPDNTVGSQGAFAGAGAPINSPTASNGFVIFDSDFYDNGGDPTQAGMGTVPTPHTGVLETDAIDLTGHAQVEVVMSSFARNFDSRMLVAVSDDGGSTFTDTVAMHNLAVNASSANGAMVSGDISSVAGNQSNVVLQFIFDGTTGPAQGTPGYYFWQFDDVEIRDLPDHRLEFVEAAGAPPVDYLPGAAGMGQPKYGIWNSTQLRPIGADANIKNTGAQAQNNVFAELQIWDAATATVVQTLTTPTTASLAAGATLDFNSLTMSSQWTPPTNEASYLLVWRAISDSVGPGKPGMEDTDTASIFVNDDLYGLDDNETSNFFGTNSLASGTVVGAVVQYDMDNGYPSSWNKVSIEGVQIALSSQTDSLGDIEIQVFDTTGFFGNPTPLMSELFPLSGGVVGSVADFEFTQAVDVPAQGSYYVRVNFFPTTGNTVRIANSGTWAQPGLASLLISDAGDFFSGFTNSRSFEAPHIRAIVDTASDYVGLNDLDANNAFIAFPNPTTGSLNLKAGVSGKYELSVINMVGQVVRDESVEMTAGQVTNRNFSDLQAGVYLLNVVGEGLNETIKLTIK